MNRSQILYDLQQIDSSLDSAHKRIQDIDTQLKDRKALEAANKNHDLLESKHKDKLSLLKAAEHEVSLQNTKVSQNQKKLYSGVITNPKELEDLQLEGASLAKYLQVLEDRQLEAMMESEHSQSNLDDAAEALQEIIANLASEHASLNTEKTALESDISDLTLQKQLFLESQEIPDLPVYQSLRNSSGGIAVTKMTASSCASCGASIPSAIEQEAKSPAKLAFCPTCKRILHPG